MVKKSLEIHSENILPIIKKWLYSDKEVFVRELVSNACDAIYKLKILRDQGLVESAESDYRIEILIDKEARTLKFIDTGIGMDAEEVQKYIAQIAFSGAEDFVQKYQSNDEKDQFIGHFGLGFYSAYMVADKVEIQTLSYKKDAEPVFWSCDGSSDYTIEKGSRQTRGTEITLFINEDSDEFLEESRLSYILNQYCAFLPYPIYLKDNLINKNEPLWIKPSSECSEQDYLDFYHQLYPMDEDPLFWVHLNVDYPFHLKGILYFPKIQRELDLNKSTVKLYCNRVFVSDNCKDVIPNYLMVLRGIIDSPDIPLNVSRSYLQMDRVVRQLGSHISKKVSDSLNVLYRDDRKRFLEYWDDISLIIKLGALEDEKFYERVKQFLVWKTLTNNWVTVEEYLDSNREKTKDKILYTKDEKHLPHIQDLYRQKEVDVLCANSPIDHYLIEFLEKKIVPARFQRIDGALDDSLIDASREKHILDAEGKTEAGRLADLIRAKLGDEHVEVEAKSLMTDTVPGFVVLDENQRRLRDYMRQLDPNDSSGNLNKIGKRTFIANTNSPLMRAVQQLDQHNPELAEDLVKEVFELSLLSQREMNPDGMNEFILRSTRLLEKMTEEIVRSKTGSIIRD